jgi:exodeoxyribonuclease V alpha subunit
MLKRGFAKAVFAEAYQRSPWLSPSKEHEQILLPTWPFLDLLLSQQRLTYLDYVLTHRLLRPYPEIGQEVALFICHLTLAAKEGHLCVRVSNEGINPSVTQLWKDQEGHSVTLEEARTLTQWMLEGAKGIPSSLITVLTKQDTAMPRTPLCCEGNDFYLQRHWIFETLFLKSLKKHLKTQPTLALDGLKIKQTVEQLCQEKVLLQEQAQAIIQGCTHGLTLVTGGPGTGKTYTAGQLIKVFWQHLSQEQRENCQIVLAAPTGKAAANLQRSLSQVAAHLENFPPIQAKTLHALLGIKQSFSHTEQVRLTADLIIVDESSMIDVRMMSCLFEAIKEGSRLILLGDQHQLPSVEAGSIFLDLIHLQARDPHLAIPCTQLVVCLRAELKSLIDFAQLVNQGKGQEVLACLNQSSGVGIKRLPLAVDKKEAQRQFLAHVLGHFPTVVKKDQDPEQLLELFHAIRILSPMRKGPFGFESLNQLIWQQVCQKTSKNGWLAIPIMVVTNDYRQDLFNGETGVLLRRLPLQTLGVEDYAIFPSRQSSGGMRRLPALLLPKYDYAYCLSVHKSQGSEFDHVILVLPEGAELFGREVFYTAVTRARKQIEVCGSDLIILKTVMQQGMRLSGIEQRLTTKEWIEE